MVLCKGDKGKEGKSGIVARVWSLLLGIRLGLGLGDDNDELW